MKYPKIFFLTLIVLFVSGCSAEYNLEIKDGRVYEEGILLEPNSYYETNDIASEIDTIIFLNDDDSNFFSYYQKDKVIGSNRSGVKLFEDFSLNNFHLESPFVDYCYPETTFRAVDGIMTLKTSKQFKCWNHIDETLTINIKTDYEVVSNNATRSNGNTYTWEFDSRDSNNEIIMQMRQAAVTEEKEFIPSMPIVYIVGALVIVATSAVYIMKKRSEKNNRI